MIVPPTRTLAAAVLLALLAAQGARAPVLPADELPAGLPRAAGEPLPLGLPEALPIPDDNPFSAAKLSLGRRLFFDPILSRDRSVSCASCHQPARGFTSGERFSLGVAGRRTSRNAPTLLNRAFAAHFMWDGRTSSLEEQVLLPIENELEMDLTLDEAVARLREREDYARAFEETCGAPPDAQHLARVLATFVRGLVVGDSPVDRFRAAGEEGALTEAERTGVWVFESKGGCWRCHSGPNLSDEGFHNTGVGSAEGVPEAGRMAITGDAADRGRFKTPTLRALARTAPYMHDGSLATLADVVEFYRRGAAPNANLDPRLHPLELTDREAAGLVAFLEALSRAAD